MAPSTTRGPIVGFIPGAVIAALFVSALGGCTTPTAAFEVSGLQVASGGVGGVITGDEVTVSARVENTGTQAGTYEAVLSIDGTVTQGQAVTLRPGEARDVTFTVTAGAPGRHAITIGPLAATLDVAVGTRIEVTDVRLTSASPEILTGDPVEIIAAVGNSGTLAGDYAATLMLDGRAVDTIDVALAAGERTSVLFQVTAGVPGLHRVQVGDATATFAVLAPADLKVTALALSPNPVPDDGDLVAQVTIANAGGATGSLKVAVAIDGDRAGTADVTLAGGDSTIVDVPLAVPKAGKHSVTVGDLKERLVVWHITRPKNGTVLTNKIKGGRGALTIENGNELDAVLILAKTSSPKKAVLVVYVRADSTARIKGIKDGTYIVYYSIGKRWDAKSKTFTVGGERRRFEDTIRFKTVRTSTMITWDVWTLTLNAVIGGNAPTQGVPDGEFPGVP